MSRIVSARKKSFSFSTLFFGQFLFCMMGALCLFLILRHSDTAIEHMSRGLRLCAGTVIPSLFPFMVLSELMVESGCGMLLGKLCERPMRHLFGTSGAGACALIMGLICGFPTGTKTAVSLCQHGQITPSELSRLICFCNIPSSAFLINVVGVSLFSSRRFGLMLYGICLLSSLFTAWLLQRIHPLSSEETFSTANPAPMHIGVFTHAVTSAASAMLYVCAYVVFFTAVVGTLGELLKQLTLGQSVIAALFGFFELSGGVMEASAIADNTAAGILTAALCGWSGISVHLQILSLCDILPDHPAIRTRPYFLCKLFQAILCAILCGIFLYFFPSLRPVSGQYPSYTTLPTFHTVSSALYIYVALIVFSFALLLCHIYKDAVRRHKASETIYTKEDLSPND